jgi:hypothetical protein
MNIIKNIPALIQNKGWEFGITADIIKRKDFSWSLNGNLTVPANKLLRYPGIENSTYSSFYTVGYSVNALKRYHSLGIDKNTGLYTFNDIDKSNTFTATDYQILGKLDPKYYGGIVNSFQYHEFRLDFLLEFKNQTVPNYFYSVYLNGLTPGLLNNQTTAVLERWKKSGDITDVQKFAAFEGSATYALNKTIAYSDAVYTSGAYLKVKNVAVSYSMKKETVNKLKLQNLRVYIQGQNLFTFTRYKGFDPETPYYFSLPPLRVIKVGLQIGL